jgi:septum formation protein
MNRWQKPIFLASSSPRREKLLKESGIEVISSPPRCDDGVFTCGTMSVERWVQSLSVLKAQNVAQRLDKNSGTVLAADTVCVIDEKILGQPKSEEEARDMLYSMLNRTHDVLTGWCLSSVNLQHLSCGYECSEITIGSIDDEEIEKYLRTSNWEGKAGGYNLSDRVNAGWPIVCVGDPTNVMGLPMNRIQQELARDRD